jgi:hypothetical protein
VGVIVSKLDALGVAKDSARAFTFQVECRP